MVNKDGYLDISNKPGWGVELNEEAFASMPPALWSRGASFRADGSPYFQELLGLLGAGPRPAL